MSIQSTRIATDRARCDQAAIAAIIAEVAATATLARRECVREGGEAMDEYLTGDQVAAILGVSRRTVYRWMEIERIPLVWTHETIAPLAGIGKLPKGPPRRRYSLRYTVYRHRFNEVRK